MLADFELVGIGNALIDVFADLKGTATPNIIEELVSLETNRHISHDQLATLVSELSGPVLCAGGGAANTIKLAAQLGIHSAFIGSVGRDEWRNQFAQELSAAGAAPLLVCTEKPTGGCVILRKAGEAPRIVASPSAALELGPEHINEEVIRQSRLIMIDGYILGRTALVDHIVHLAERYGTFIALDAGSEAIVQAHADRLETYCKTKPLMLFLNEAEAKAFCHHLDPRLSLVSAADIDETDLYRPLQTLTRHDIFPIIAVKRGDQGGLVYANGEIYRAPTQAIVPFDTTGAGDAFAAGFIAGWLRGKSLEDCADLGNQLAREIIQIPGTRIATQKLARYRRII
ncbi:adenosine kinase [Gracilinema caldarium]|uniref:PfkB domain protein n=1 Tax=Gracilinema caldarium (strain ATCC 51460 / DSM 7334 / H1) TaxID=744872 RepID=F8F3V9_GRAC1|nr:adenosine kinase [Gracilinema caldarium]AEJ20478.1 PfkB domain protein [Gracilinema caldarium DSM 7334]